MLGTSIHNPTTTPPRNNTVNNTDRPRTRSGLSVSEILTSVATRPKVHRSEVALAIVRIASRRRKVDDRDREMLPDSPESDPREVLDYLQKHSGFNIPGWVLQAEVCDALILNNWLWWDDRRRELYFLKAGRERGILLSELGAQVGVGKQGLLDRIDRLEALLRFDRPDEKMTRDARRAESERTERLTVEQTWVAARQDELSQLISDVVEQANRFAVKDREWIDELEIDRRDDDIGPTTMVILGLAVAELRTAPGVLSLDSTRPYGVHTLLARADRLRRDFAQLGASTSRPSNRARDVRRRATNGL